MSEEFCKRVKEAIPDETKASKDYSELAVMIRRTKPSLAVQLNEIAIDETRHHGILKKIEKDVCPT